MSAAILFSSAGASFFSAKETGHMAPSSRFAASSKPNVAYLDLNLAAAVKKQTTLPSLFAYAGIPYQVFGERAGAFALTIAWIFSARARSGSGISAIFASTSFSQSALSASAFSSLARSFIAARSSAVNPLDALLIVLAGLAGFLSTMAKPPSSVLKQPENVAIGVGNGGHQAATTDVSRGLFHGGTRGGHFGQLRLDVRH